MRAIFVLSALSLGLSACGTSGGDCDEGTFSCEGTVLYECTDGESVLSEDCADVGLECHAEMGHCMDPMADSGM